MELEFSRWIYFHLRSKIFFLALLREERGGGQSPPSSLPPMDPPLIMHEAYHATLEQGVASTAA